MEWVSCIIDHGFYKIALMWVGLSRQRARDPEELLDGAFLRSHCWGHDARFPGFRPWQRGEARGLFFWGALSFHSPFVLHVFRCLLLLRLCVCFFFGRDHGLWSWSICIGVSQIGLRGSVTNDNEKWYKRHMFWIHLHVFDVIYALLRVVINLAFLWFCAYPSCESVICASMRVFFRSCG